MAQALRTPTITPDFVGGNNFINTNSPASNISSNLMPNGRLKGSLTYGMQKFADGIDAIYRVQAQATAKEMDNRFSQAAQNTLFDPDNGYYNKKGKAAVDGYKSAVETLKADFQQGKNGVEDPFIQRMYDQSTGARLQTMLNQAQQHYAEGVFSWNVSESKARIANLGNTAITAINSWNDDKGVYMQYRNAIDGEVDDMAEMYGMDKKSEQYANLKTESLTTFHSGALDMFLAKDSVGSASGYLKKFRSEMDADTVAKYENKIHDLADRLEAKRERLAAKQAAMQAKPETLMALANARYRQELQALEDKKNSMSKEEYDAAINKLDKDYTTFTEGVMEQDYKNKATKIGAINRFKDSVMVHKIEQNRDKINRGEITNLEDIFDGTEMQKLKEYGLLDDAKVFAFKEDPTVSHHYLTMAKSVPDITTPQGRLKANEYKIHMIPSDAQALDAYIDKKARGEKTTFSDQVKTYSLNLIGINDGKMPKVGTRQHSKYLNITDELRDRVSRMVRDVPKVKLNNQVLKDILNEAFVELKPKYKKKGMLWDSTVPVPRDDFGNLTSVSDAFVDYQKSNGESVQLPLEFVNNYKPLILRDVLTKGEIDSGSRFDDLIIDKLSEKYKQVQNQNTAVTNAIIDK